jgi:hypothetical protein
MAIPKPRFKPDKEQVALSWSGFLAIVSHCQNNKTANRKRNVP